MATISTSGIAVGQIIRSEHLLRVINALNGVTPIDIIITGSLSTSGSLNVTGSTFLKGLPNTSRANVITYDPTTGQLSYLASASLGVTMSVSQPGGSDTQVQYNSGSFLAGNSAFRFIYNSSSLTLGANTSTGLYSFTQGNNLTASGNFSHAQGSITKATNISAHAEGESTWASGQGSHAEGQFTAASGNYSHAEGSYTSASGESSHAEGFNTQAVGPYSHAEGAYTTAEKDYSHTEGYYNLATGLFSHAEGLGTVAAGTGSKAEGIGIPAYDPSSPFENIFDAFGLSIMNAEFFELFAIDQPVTSLTTLTAAGDFTSTVTYPYRIPYLVVNFYLPTQPYAVVLESATYNGGTDLTTFTVSGLQQYYPTNTVDYTLYTLALGDYSHAEGETTKTYGRASHAEGITTIASGSYSHAEGWETEAIGTASHAEGYQTKAIGISSHAEGVNTIAQGNYSHAEGVYTIASGNYQHVQGQYNISSSAESAFIIGNGTSEGARRNLLFASGTQVQITGSLQVSGSITGSLFGTASFATSASRAISSSFAISASWAPSTAVDTSSLATTGSNTFRGNQVITGSLTVTQGITGSLFGTASFATSASFANSSSFAVSASWAPSQAVDTSSLVTILSFNAFTSSYNTGSFTGSFTGSLFGTSSWAISASFATSASWAPNTSPISITGSTLYSTTPAAGPGFGVGNQNSIFLGEGAGDSATNAFSSSFIGQGAGSGSTNANNSNFMGFKAGLNALNANNSNFIGLNAGTNAASASNSNFIGWQAGANATNSSGSNFIGYGAGTNATNAFSSNFIGYQAGIFSTDCNNSNFIGTLAGATTLGEDSKNEYSNCIGYWAGRYAVSSSFSTLIGYKAGFNLDQLTPAASIGLNNIVIGTNITLASQQKDSINLGGIIFATGSYFDTGSRPFSGSVANARVGIGTSTPQNTLDVSGSARITNGLTVTGSSILDGVVNLGTTSSTTGELVVYGNNSTLLLTRGNGDSSIRLNTGDTTLGSSGSLYVLSNQFFEINTSNRLKLATGNKERITIQNDGGIIINSGSQATAPTVLQVTGSVSISDILTLTRRTTTPTPVEGMIIASGSAGASILYYYNGTTWNALF